MGERMIVDVACRQLRSWGRQALSGQWKLAVAASLLFMLLNAGPVLIMTLLFDQQVLDWASNLYGLLVSGPLTLGYVAFALRIFRRKEPAVGDVLSGFENFSRSLLLFLLVNFFILLWSLLFIIPGIIAAYRYAMAFYVLADDPAIGVREAMETSKRLMAGNKWKLFSLELSFIGWMILSALTMGVGFFWLLPYMTASTAGFYEVANGNLRLRQPAPPVSPIEASEQER